MKPHERSLLSDIQHGCQQIVERLGGRSREQYSQDRSLQLAIERLFVIIGEAGTRLVKHFPNTAAAIVNLKEAIQFRNFLVHVYDQIQNPKVWDIAETDIPKLLAEVETMLASCDGE